MKFEKWICTHCSKDVPCILNIPKDSSATPLKCPMSPDDVAKPNWELFNEDDVKIVNITLKGTNKISFDGSIDVKIPDGVIVNLETK